MGNNYNQNLNQSNTDDTNSHQNYQPPQPPNPSYYPPQQPVEEKASIPLMSKDRKSPM